MVAQKPIPKTMEGRTDGFVTAVSASLDDRTRRTRAMGRQLHKSNVNRWARSFLTALGVPERSASYNNGMDFSALGPWVMSMLAAPALVVTLVALVALRGTRPEQRPSILHALADLARALQFRSGYSRVPTMPPEEPPGPGEHRVS